MYIYEYMQKFSPISAVSQNFHDLLTPSPLSTFLRLSVFPLHIFSGGFKIQNNWQYFEIFWYGQYFENFKAVNRSIPDSDRLYCDTNP